MLRAAKNIANHIVVIFSLSQLVVFSAYAQSAAEVRAKAEDLNRQGILRIGDKNFDKAIEHLSKAVEIDPQFSQGYLNLGTAHLMSGRPEVGIGFIKKGVELDPMSYKGFNQLGVAYDKLRRPDLAIEALTRAIELKPDYAFGYFNLGKAYLYSDRAKQAEEVLKKGLKLDPANDDGKLHLATVYAKQRKFREAIAIAKDIAQRRPTDEMVNMVLCKIYLLADDRDSALGLYQSFKSTNVSLADQMFRSIFGSKILDASQRATP